ncbi:hypothetical protein, partial [Bradyrhizobium sp. PRIMUS42]
GAAARGLLPAGLAPAVPTIVCPVTWSAMVIGGEKPFRKSRRVKECTGPVVNSQSGRIFGGVIPFEFWRDDVAKAARGVWFRGRISVW